MRTDRGEGGGVGAGGRAGGRVGLLTCQREGELKVVGWRLIGIGEGFPNQRGGQRERGGSRVYIYIYIYIYIYHQQSSSVCGSRACVCQLTLQKRPIYVAKETTHALIWMAKETYSCTGLVVPALNCKRDRYVWQKRPTDALIWQERPTHALGSRLPHWE